MKIDINKKYRTRAGEKPEQLHRAPESWPGKFPWRGMVGDLMVSWTDDGTEFEGRASSYDLIEVREPLEVTWIVNKHGTVFCSHDDPATWDIMYPHTAPHRIAKFREVIEEPTNPTP